MLGWDVGGVQGDAEALVVGADFDVVGNPLVAVLISMTIQCRWRKASGDSHDAESFVSPNSTGLLPKLASYRPPRVFSEQPARKAASMDDRAVLTSSLRRSASYTDAA
jgi:hypothetical protein